ncbi:MAG: hypothetical protein JST40_00515 [Armatimonadetes bacterium]|nr:hypothetical protein [Armatimonadota bacterium]
MLDAPLTSGEKTLAGALNLAAIPMPYVGPVIGLVIGSQSKFVRFHAFRCLIEQIFATALTLLVVATSLGYSIYTMVKNGVFDHGIDVSKIDWVTLLIKSAITWIAFGLWNLWNVVNSVLDAIQAFSGALPRRFGWCARRAARLSGIMTLPQSQG